MRKDSNEFTERSRTRAMSIKSRLQGMGFNVTLGQAYEVLASADGFRNWPTMKAIDARSAPMQAKLSEPIQEDKSELDELINEFMDFVEKRQGQFLPRNKMMIFGGTSADRLAIAENIAMRFGLKLAVLTNLQDLPIIDSIGNMADWFSTAGSPGEVLFIDDITRLEDFSGRNISRLCVYLDEVPPTKFVIVGARSGETMIDNRVFRRVHYRHIMG
jgi:hypothetical protein